MPFLSFLAEYLKTKANFYVTLPHNIELLEFNKNKAWEKLYVPSSFN